MLHVVNDILQAKGLLLRAGMAVDATLIAAPGSTQNASGERDAEMKQTKKGNNWYFGMKAHIGVDADSGLVHTVAGTAANMSDLNMAGALLHGQGAAQIDGDAGMSASAQRQTRAAALLAHVAHAPMADFSMPALHSASTFAFVAFNAPSLSRC